MNSLMSIMAELERSGQAFALVTVIDTAGSAPRHIGAKMVVTADTTYGTIGGGAVEKETIEAVREALASGEPRLLEFTLTPETTGMACGGAMKIFLDPVNVAPTLYIFGARHVGYAVADFASKTGFRVVVVDSRPEWATAARFPGAAEVLTGDCVETAKNLQSGPEDYIVILTHSHALDQTVLAAVLEKEYRYVGLICSKKKKVVIFNNLERAGKSGDLLEKVHSPIGLKINAETPEEIAVSILAELILVRRGGKS